MRRQKESDIKKLLKHHFTWGKYERNPNYVAGERERRKYIRNYWKYEVKK